jgi:hypothetical protein
MSHDHHTPHAYLAPLTSTELNAPLGELDAAITAGDAAEAATRAAADSAEVTNRDAAISTAVANEATARTTAINTAVSGEATLRVGADITTSLGGKMAVLDASAATGQKVIPLAGTDGIASGDAGTLSDGTNSERVVVDTIAAGASITALANLGHTYAAGAVLTLDIAPLAQARGPVATVDQRLAGSATGSTQRLLEKLFADAADAVLVVCSDSTGRGDLNYWPRQLAAALGVDWPRYTVQYAYWDDATMAYLAPTTLQTGTGSHTLRVWNTSISGMNVGYFLQHVPEMVTSKSPDLVMIALGHNEYSVAANRADWWRDRILTMGNAVTELAPSASVCLVSQNVRYDTPGYMADQINRLREYARAAAMMGWGFLDVWHAFWAQGTPADSYLTSDGIHPTPTTGQTCYLNAVHAAFVRSPWSDYEAQQPSTFIAQPGTVNLVSNGDLSSFASPPTLPGFNAFGASLSKDLVNLETKGYGVRITATGAAASFIANDNTQRFIIGPQLAGSWVTVAARVFVKAATATITAGAVQLADGVNSAFSSGALHYDRWWWSTASFKVAATATFLAVYVYGDTANNANADVVVDRIILVRGQLPRDIV